MPTQKRSQKEKLFNLLINEIKDFAIFTLDPQGTILSWNPGATNLLGYTEKDVIGKPLSVIFPQDAEKNHLHQDLEIAIKNSQYEHETYVYTKNKKKIWVHCIVTSLWDKEGKLQGFSKIVQDISERKQMESKREDFISMAGHELKNPITSIKSYVQILQLRLARQNNTELQNFTGKIDMQVDKLTSLVGDLIDTSRLAAGNLTFKDDDIIDIDTFISGIVEVMQPTFPQHRLQVKGQTKATWTGDKTRLEQVITNLLLNAIKYSPNANSVIIHLSTNTDSIVIGIEDFGIGISKGEIPKIFKRFQRLEEAKKIGSGLGLGLHLAREIVLHYKGHIWVESKPRKGSIFFVRLPKTIQQ